MSVCGGKAGSHRKARSRSEAEVGKEGFAISRGYACSHARGGRVAPEGWAEGASLGTQRSLIFRNNLAPARPTGIHSQPLEPDSEPRAVEPPPRLTKPALWRRVT